MTKNENSIVFGGGCFWCIEAIFQMINGVISVMPGYAGGITKNPTYDSVCSGDTGHAEVIKIEYSNSLDLNILLQIFFEMHDPTTLNRQGADIGTQYRSIILYTTNLQKESIDRYILKLQSTYDRKIVTEIKKLDVFYPAEDYHVNYYKNNAKTPYCGIVIGPKIAKIKKEFGALLKQSS
ncbi:MAG: peptide-methionine (S)-S-oxide reductase MsrA [Candidatus Marsarchaeota archaeon]|nr:peptide-methionine (S)-S-oxide reductase MsrA [Candidatus Marsarchaeota archaeon]